MPTFSIAAQLYTLRDFTDTADGLRQVLGAMATIGYDSVQLSAVKAMDGTLPAVSAKTCREWLDAEGLGCAATHRPWSRLLHHTQAEIDWHHALDCDYIAIGGIPAEFGNHPDGFRTFLAEADPVVTRLGEAGIRFGIHNHAHEFRRFNNVPLYQILEVEARRDIYLEVDTYWVVEAGVDPIALLSRCSGRVPAIHVKDREVLESGPAMAPVGEGNLNWVGILEAASSAGVETLIVEQDICQRDPFDCLASSHKFLQGLVDA